jgi:hypothetical protein
VIERCEAALGLTKQLASVANKPVGGIKEIHQLLPNLVYGDAISNHALAIRDYLRSCGYKSDILLGMSMRESLTKSQYFSLGASVVKRG